MLSDFVHICKSVGLRMNLTKTISMKKGQEKEGPVNSDEKFVKKIKNVCLRAHLSNDSTVLPVLASHTKAA